MFILTKDKEKIWANEDITRRVLDIFFETDTSSADTRATSLTHDLDFSLAVPSIFLFFFPWPTHAAAAVTLALDLKHRRASERVREKDVNVNGIQLHGKHNA
jgi:hypothetical protein